MPNPLANDRIQTTLAAVLTKAVGSYYRIRDDKNNPPEVQDATKKRESFLLLLTAAVTPVMEKGFKKFAMPFIAPHINVSRYQKLLMAPPIMMGLFGAEALCRVIFPKVAMTPYTVYKAGVDPDDGQLKVTRHRFLRRPQLHSKDPDRDTKALEKSEDAMSACQFRGRAVPLMPGLLAPDAPSNQTLAKNLNLLSSSNPFVQPKKSTSMVRSSPNSQPSPFLSPNPAFKGSVANAQPYGCREVTFGAYSGGRGRI